VATADIRANEKAVTAKARVRYLDEIGVEFDEDKIDRIELFYEDSPEATIRATVNRLLSDRDEGMGLV
jgi:hypothetical protein